jgi:hypothetical protein
MFTLLWFVSWCSEHNTVVVSCSGFNNSTITSHRFQSLIISKCLAALMLKYFLSDITATTAVINI